MRFSSVPFVTLTVSALLISACSTPNNTRPTTRYLDVPRVSSGARRYITVALLYPDAIATDALLTIANSDWGTLGHIAQHRQAGERIPEDVDERLIEERASAN